MFFFLYLYSAFSLYFVLAEIKTLYVLFSLTNLYWLSYLLLASVYFLYGVFPNRLVCSLPYLNWSYLYTYVSFRAVNFQVCKGFCWCPAPVRFRFQKGGVESARGEGNWQIWGQISMAASWLKNSTSFYTLWLYKRLDERREECELLCEFRSGIEEPRHWPWQINRHHSHVCQWKNYKFLLRDKNDSYFSKQELSSSHWGNLDFCLNVWL